MKSFPTTALILSGLLFFIVAPMRLHAQGTAFTYQGVMTDPAGKGLTGTYDLEFDLFDAQTNGNQIATARYNAVSVTSGLLNIQVDFGAQFDGNPRWLEIKNLTLAVTYPLQQITPTPYAIFAGKAGVFLGTIADMQLSTNIPQLNAANVFTASNKFNGVVTATNVSNNVFGIFTGDGAGLTGISVPASNVSGTFTPGQLPAGVLTNGASGVALNGTLTGNLIGNATTASSVSGVIPDLQLSSNVALLDGTNIFTGPNTFNGVVIVTNVSNNIFGIFTGNGAGLTGVNVLSSNVSGPLSPSQLPVGLLTNNETGVTLSGAFIGNLTGNASTATAVTGPIPDAQLSANVALLNASNTFTSAATFTSAVTATNPLNNFSGNFSGNGAGLTALNAVSLTGNIADALLSPNVALLNSNQTFTGYNTFTGVAATGTIKALGGLVIENRTNDPPAAAVGQIWLRTDL